jgi:hypothetical protein
MSQGMVPRVSCEVPALRKPWSQLSRKHREARLERQAVQRLRFSKMAKKELIPERLKIWMEARRRFRLSHMHIQMARELGMNPKKFGGLANHHQEPWKAPLPIFIETIYFKRFGKEKPDKTMTIREISAAHLAKKQARRLAKALKREAKQAALADSSLSAPGNVPRATAVQDPPQASASAGADHPFDRAARRS